jgi:hypothetical protein
VRATQHDTGRFVNSKTLLELGRVSNLPTVWSNVLAASAFAATGSVGASAVNIVAVGACIISGSLLYEGGMLLNDAYDAEIDARERPNRPIPSGRATRGQVFGLGFGLLVTSFLVLAASVLLGAVQPWALLGLSLTAAFVVAYDKHHKGVAWSPLLMGACRAGLYLLATLAVGAELGWPWALRALALFLYVVGLTHVARFETGSVVRRAWVLFTLFGPALVALWLDWSVLGRIAPFLLAQFGWVLFCLRLLASKREGRIGRTVVALIAGISLVDALFASGSAEGLVSLACVAAFALTLGLQRWVRGT